MPYITKDSVNALTGTLKAKSPISGDAINALTGLIGNTKLGQQNFGTNDSVIASTVMHPINAMAKFKDWMAQQEMTAAGMPVNQDEGSMYAYAPSREAQAEAGLNIAGTAQLGGMPAAPSSAGGTLGTFIGPKATGWNKEAAAKASQMLDEGVDPAQVWREHMIGRMPDRSLFSEIPDNTASFNKNPSYEHLYSNATVKNTLNHDDLINNYPGLNTIDLKNSGKDGTGAYSETGRSILIPADDEKSKSVLMHELQHAVQSQEGWARGGSTNEEFNNVFRENNELKRLVNNAGMSKDAALRFLGLPEDIGYENYRRLTGEAQARATQDRLHMDLDARRNNYPLKGNKLSDINLQDLINRY